MELTIGEILGVDGRLASRISDYEIRPQQLEMAQAVAESLGRSEHLLAEAGTGTGKSFAYLVPAILHVTDPANRQEDRSPRIVVSTHTISLQEQLMGKDLPLLNSVIPREFSAVLVKGRGNYLSKRRLSHTQQRARNLFQQPEDFDQLQRIYEWSNQTTDGSRSDLSFRPAPSLWDEMASDSGNCMGRKCPTFDSCFYYKARRRAKHAQILVVNHALFFSDLALRQTGVSVIPDYDAVILDEAHTVESVASAHLGVRLTSGQVDYNLRRLFNDRTNRGLLVDGSSQEAQKQVNRCRDVSDQFFGDLDAWMTSRPDGFNGRVEESRIVANALSQSLFDLASRVKRRSEQASNDSQGQDFVAAGERLIGIAEQLHGWLEQTIPDSVYWVERSFDRIGMPRFTLAAAPLDVGSVLKAQLFQACPSVILTSATMTTGRSDFGFVQQRLGLPRAVKLKVGSPFDYQEQVRLILVTDMPDPAKERVEFERMTAAMVQRYVLRTDGCAFVLFTSYESLRKIEAMLESTLRAHDIAIYSQASGIPRQQLLESFKADPRAVLLGTDSFWQGVDVPGDSLQNVILTKLPFSVPDQPLLQARMDSIRAAGGNPFQELQLPQAIIKLRQGFGRLIRTRNDRGIVVILDPRIVNRPYGKLFLDSLPTCPIVRERASTGN